MSFSRFMTRLAKWKVSDPIMVGVKVKSQLNRSITVLLAGLFNVISKV